MPKAKMFAAVLIAVFALSAAISASAQAEPSWFVSGAKLTSKAALATKAVVDEPAVLNVPGLGLKASCSGLSGSKPEIAGPTKGQAEALSFENCSEISPSTCKISPATIRTESIFWLVHISGHFFWWNWLIHAQGGKILATITFVGSCSFAGEQPLAGAVVLKGPTTSIEETSQALEGLGSTENNSLEIAGNKAFIEGGKVLLSLASGSKWSFHE